MDYEFRESTRTKHLRVTVHPDGRVVVTKPAKLAMTAVEKWLVGRMEWIEEARNRFARTRERFERTHGKTIELPKLRRGTKAYKEAIVRAGTIASDRVRHFTKLGGFTHGSISIRNQSSRWGSCSARGNLSFNYRLAHLPHELADYLIVHELAHTKHHNHSKQFWEEVGTYIPNYKEQRRELHRYRF